MVGAPQYLNALKQLKQELTLAFFDDYIVDIVQERRHVRPCHIVAASKLLHILITNGSRNGMILPHTGGSGDKTILAELSTQASHRSRKLGTSLRDTLAAVLLTASYTAAGGEHP